MFVRECRLQVQCGTLPERRNVMDRSRGRAGIRRGEPGTGCQQGCRNGVEAVVEEEAGIVTEVVDLTNHHGAKDQMGSLRHFLAKRIAESTSQNLCSSACSPLSCRISVQEIQALQTDILLKAD